MGIKRYVLFTIVYLLAVGLYVYSFNADLYALEIYTFSFTLPIAMWIVFPAILLFVASIFHMLFYSFREFLQQRALKKDFEHFKSEVANKILGKSTQSKYKTDWFKFVGKILETFKYDVKSSDIKIDNEKITTLRDVVQDIEDGKVVELKKYKLDINSELVTKSRLNKLKEDPTYATKILKDCKDEKSLLCQKAYFEYLRYASFDEIKKLNFAPTKEMFRVLMERYFAKDSTFDISLEAIEEMLMQFKATRDDYLQLAYEMKLKLAPDELIALFEKLYNSPEHTVAAEAYLYVLYELQMIDQIREILENSDEDEYTKFKTLLFLRDHGKNVDSGLFLRFS